MSRGHSSLPSLWIENDVTWPLELPPDDDAAMTTVESTDLDSVETGVDEVQVVGHPVDGQARDALQPGVDDHLTSSDSATSSFGVQDTFKCWQSDIHNLCKNLKITTSVYQQEIFHTPRKYKNL